MLRFILILATLFQFSITNAKVEVTKGSSTIDNTKYHHFIAFDDEIQGKRPGVIVVHEWWGLNEYAKKRMKMLAELGYVAIAVDMYGMGKTLDHPKDAKEFATELRSNIPFAQKRFEIALDELKKHQLVDSNNIGAIGYCLGGGVVLNMARANLGLKSVVSFHGNLNNAVESSGPIQTKILVCHGEKDTPITAQIPDFEKEMKARSADYNIIIYKDATHSFTNPAADVVAKNFNAPVEYNQWADRKSWADMLLFLDNSFDKK